MLAELPRAIFLNPMLKSLVTVNDQFDGTIPVHRGRATAEIILSEIFLGKVPRENFHNHDTVAQLLLGQLEKVLLLRNCCSIHEKYKGVKGFPVINSLLLLYSQSRESYALAYFLHRRETAAV